jgi:hypothetical protein
VIILLSFQPKRLQDALKSAGFQLGGGMAREQRHAAAEQNLGMAPSFHKRATLRPEPAFQFGAGHSSRVIVQDNKINPATGSA